MGAAEDRPAAKGSAGQIRRERQQRSLGRSRRRGSAARGAQAAGGDRASAQAPPIAERYQQAKELLARVDRNQSRLGERFSERDLRRYEDEDAELLRSSRDPADHAHRAGYERDRFEALKGPERERAEAEIEKARKRDSKRLALVSEVPGRIVGRGRAAAERVRQGAEELGGPPAAASSCGGCAGSVAAATTWRRGATSAGGARWPPAAQRLRVALFAVVCAALLAAAIGFSGGEQSPRRRRHRPRPRGLRRVRREACESRWAQRRTGSLRPSFATRSASWGRRCGGRCAPALPPASPPSCSPPRLAARRAPRRRRCRATSRSPSPRSNRRGR